MAASSAAQLAMRTLPVAVLVGICATVVGTYSYATNSLLPSKAPALRNKRICLLIAHPDDEAMFFAPTLLALTHPDAGNHVKILCLSTGNAEGLGETRKKELVKSALMLGLRDEDDIFVLDNPDFQDAMGKTWETSKVSTLLIRGFAPYYSNPSPVSPNIDVLITFDKTGVSSHSNHISLYHGARDFIAQLARSAATARGIDLTDSNLDPATLPPPPIDLYTLTSVNFLRKYSGILDVFATVAGVGKLAPKGAPVVEAQHKQSEKDDSSDEDEDEDEESDGDVDQDAKALAPKPAGLVFAVPLTGKRGAAFARVPMLQAHISQMVWFRYGWIYLSRYMVLNSLRREIVPANATAS